MRIAQVAPLFESVPPKLYGGTERVVSFLTEELVRQGHDVTLFASGDSETAARLVSPWPEALRLCTSVRDGFVLQTLQLEQVFQRRHEFDLIHFHTDSIHFPLVRRIGTPTLTTLHGRLDLDELRPLYEEFGEIPVVSISDSQRAPLPSANWQGTVHHGLPDDLLRCNPGKPTDRYLAFTGRFSVEKQPDVAIQIARRAGFQIRIAAKVDKADQEYFEAKIKPLLDQPGVVFVGEIGEHEKSEFLGNAIALLFPIDWPEPFGLVMIESMACGTPVIAYPKGSVPEIIDDGVTGLIAENVDQAVRAVHRIRAGHIDRHGVRERFLERFSARRMASDYLKLYERMLRPAPATTDGLVLPPLAPGRDGPGRVRDGIAGRRDSARTAADLAAPPGSAGAEHARRS